MWDIITAQPVPPGDLFIPETWTGWTVLGVLILNIVLLLRQIGPKLWHDFVEMQKSRAARQAQAEKAEKTQELELTRQIYEEQKSKDERMYNLMDRFSDRLAVFSEELTKFSVTMQMIMTRLENIEKTQYDIILNQNEIDDVLNIIEDRLPANDTRIQSSSTRRRRKSVSNTDQT